MRTHNAYPLQAFWAPAHFAVALTRLAYLFLEHGEILRLAAADVLNQAGVPGVGGRALDQASDGDIGYIGGGDDDGSETDIDALIESILNERPRVDKIAIKDAKLRTFITEDSSRDDLVAHVYDITYGTVERGVDNLVVIDDSFDSRIVNEGLERLVVLAVDFQHPDLTDRQRKDSYSERGQMQFSIY